MSRLLSPLSRRRFIHLGGLAGLSFGGLHLLSGCSDDAPASGATTGSGGAGGAPGGACDKAWWNCGNYASVPESEATQLVITGTLPTALDGLYLRNGPNPLSGESAHWFLGDGMIHGTRLSGGKALWYKGRYVQTEALGAPPSSGPPTLTDHQANTSVIHHAGRTMCLLETGLPYEVRSSDLTTIGPYDFAGLLKTGMTAHPKIDPVSGEMLFFGYHLLESKITYHRADKLGNLNKSEDIALPAAVMMHDFQVTATRIVLMDLPILFDIQLAIAGEGFPFRWAPENGARLGVLPRDGTAADVQWFDIEPCFIFHTFNAYDDPSDANRLVLEGVRYSEMWVQGANDFNASAAVWRFVMDLSTGKVTQEQVGEKPMEFPQIDHRRQGLEHRYGFALQATPGDNGAIVAARELIKVDRQLGKEDAYTMPDGMQIDEPTFVPASESAGEDEGWLMMYAYDPGSDKSALLVLDAQNPGETVARVDLPTRVPHGFHGTWIQGG